MGIWADLLNKLIQFDFMGMIQATENGCNLRTYNPLPLDMTQPTENQDVAGDKTTYLGPFGGCLICLGELRKVQGLKMGLQRLHSPFDRIDGFVPSLIDLG